MDERETLIRAIDAQEQLRGTVPDDVIDATIATLRERLGVIDQSAATRQRKQATILFADVSGFTAMSETMDAEDLSDSLDGLWRRLDGVIVGHNGMIDKHIGDAVMGVWGADGAREDDPEQAIRAALAMQEAMAEMAAADHTVKSLAVRIGINTGPVLLGEVGTTGEFTATGDAVNVASRLESAAPVGGVLISHDTYRHVRGIFSVAERPLLDVKGKSEPLRTYTVNAVQPRPFRLPSRGVEGIETRMIGRDDDLALLLEAQRRTVADSAAERATIIGEAGIGKSRLLYEFQEQLNLSPEYIRLFRGRGDQQHQGTPYGLLRDVIFFRFEIADDDPLDVAIAKLEGGITGFLGPRAMDQAHLIGHLIGLDMSDSPYVGQILDDPRQLSDRASHAVVQIFTAAADQNQAVVLIEDIHWADRATLGLVDQVMDSCTNSRLFVVTAARPSLYDGLPEWGNTPADFRIDLNPLSAAASGALIDEVLKMAGSVPAELRDMITANADGNPFYVEEIVKMLIENGAVTAGVDEWTVNEDRLRDFQVPPTVTGVVQARLDRLDPDERDTMQRASVVGRIFWDLAIPPPAQGDPPTTETLHSTLEALQIKELVWPHEGPDFSGTLEYTFKHAIFREVTYESVLKRLRRGYHRSVAEWLAGRSEARTRAAMIANHYELAEAPVEAGAWFATAGEQAQARFANIAAETYFRKALDNGGLDAETRLHVNDGLSDVLMLTARYDEAVEALHDAIAAAGEVGDVGSEARALTGIAFVRLREGKNREALEMAESAEAKLLEFSDPKPEELSEAVRGVASALLRLGDTTLGLERCQEALRLARHAHDHKGIARCLGLMGAIHNSLSQYRDASERFGEALEIDRERGDRRAEAAWLIGMGELARLQAEYARAAELFGEGLAIQRAVGDIDQEPLTLSNLGGATMGMGRYRDALRFLGEAEAAFAEAGGTEHLSETKRFAAQALLGLGDLDGAEAAVAEAIQLAEKDENPDHLGHAWRVKGLVASDRGEAVGEQFAKAVEIFDRAGMERDGAIARWQWAAADPDQAERWAEAVEVFTRLDLRGFLERMAAERSVGA